MKRAPWGCLAAIIAVLGAGLALWFFGLEPIVEHQRWERRVFAGIQALRRKCPENVTPVEWEYCVDWTQNLHVNWGVQPHYMIVTREEKWQFLEEFERRLEGRVDLTTIDWFWDEYARITEGGQRYDGHRPTRNLPLPR